MNIHRAAHNAHLTSTQLIHVISFDHETKTESIIKSEKCMQQAGRQQASFNEHETWTAIEFNALNRISIFADTHNWMWRKAEMEIEESTKSINKTKTRQSIDHFFCIVLCNFSCGFGVSNEQWEFFVSRLCNKILLLEVLRVSSFFIDLLHLLLTRQRRWMK